MLRHLSTAAGVQRHRKARKSHGGQQTRKACDSGFAFCVPQRALRPSGNPGPQRSASCSATWLRLMARPTSSLPQFVRFRGAGRGRVASRESNSGAAAGGIGNRALGRLELQCLMPSGPSFARAQANFTVQVDAPRFMLRLCHCCLSLRYL